MPSTCSAEARLTAMIFNLRRLYGQARDWGDNYVMSELWLPPSSS